MLKTPNKNHLSDLNQYFYDVENNQYYSITSSFSLSNKKVKRKKNNCL